jgi:DNA repair protein RecN (Recombination protein N)
MLRDLRVQHFALFDDVRIAFGPRLNVLTGETGAGKSLVVDAVTMIRGGRASPDLIRSGCDEAIVEAWFTVPSGSSAAVELAALGYPADEDLVVQRVLSASGRGRVYVNGRPTSVAALAQVTGSLIDLHSQHEYQSLARSDTPLAVLDAYARVDDLRRDYERAWAEWSVLDQALASRSSRETIRSREVALLAHEVEELSQANVQLHEWDDLERERTILRHAGRLHEVSRGASDRLQAQDGGVLDGVRGIVAELGAVGAIDPKLADAADLAGTALVQLQEVATVLRGYADRFDHDEGRLDAIESRLAEVQRLRRKYGVPVDELPALLERKCGQLVEFERETESDHTLGPQSVAVRRRVDALADELHLRRMDASATVESLVDVELSRLGMPARFHVEIAPLGEPGTVGSSGRDRVEFLIRTNPGEPEKPLRKIASGGELSRVMLALKSVLASVDSVPTLVFDEADAGVGGAVAEVVGRRLRAIADHRQVLCVTHLPQVASGADAHFLVAKSVERGRTSTTVRQLRDRARVREVARMLAGQRITATALRHAEEMIRLVSAPPDQRGATEVLTRPAWPNPQDAGP